MRILAICTGNTCRSPMFAALLGRELAERGIEAEVRSAGTAASAGEPASVGARHAMAELGLNLSAHRATPLSAVDATDFDLVLAMTSRHAVAARAAGVEAVRLAVIAAESGGVPDPFGGDASDYASCAEVLLREAQRIADELGAPGDLADPVELARAALDQANAEDPERGIDGGADALRYAAGIDRWVARLVERPGPALRIAARGQHLERWVIPRASFPIDRPGYLKWRRAVQVRQGERAVELISGIVGAELAIRVGDLVSKSVKGDPDGQALEDAACLLFLEAEIAGFAAEHQDYDEARYLTILRRTWVKMSPRAHDLALALPLEQPFKGLLERALAG